MITVFATYLNNFGGFDRVVIRYVKHHICVCHAVNKLTSVMVLFDGQRLLDHFLALLGLLFGRLFT